MAVKVRKWKGAWWLFTTHRGKRKAKRIGAGKENYEKAKLAAKELERRLSLGDLGIFLGGPRFQDAAERWLTEHERQGQIRESTAWLYRHNLQAYVFPRFGSTPATTIRRSDIRAQIADLRGQGKSLSLVRNVLAPVRQTFGQLIDDEVISANPAARLGLKSKGEHYRVEPLTIGEELRLLETAREHCPRYFPLFLCALRTGLRLGE